METQHPYRPATPAPANEMTSSSWKAARGYLAGMALVLLLAGVSSVFRSSLYRDSTNLVTRRDAHR
jgi:hypothetical protein